MKNQIELVYPVTSRRNSTRRSVRRSVALLVTVSALLLLAMTHPVLGADGGLPGGNTAEGDIALNSIDGGSGAGNTAIGNSALFTDTVGNDNTASGTFALYHNRSGSKNTANGVQALFNNNGTSNTAVGWSALINNTIGIQNTAIGDSALFANQGGNNNVAAGWKALSSNNGGSSNTAVGISALLGNTTGNENVAVGGNALRVNKAATANTAVGQDALENTVSGGNTATGHGALRNDTSGDINTAYGLNALLSNKSGNDNIALGADAGINLTGDNNIDIGNDGVVGESDTIRIGTPLNPSALGQNRTFIAGIYNVSEGGTIKPVYINSNGQLGTQPPGSSRRFKREIKPMDQSSEAILGLKPVTFQYKDDSTGTPQFGLIAEEVAKVNPDLVVRDDHGEIYTVRYEAVNAMLLNEFLKEHGRAIAERRKVEEQARTIQELKGLVTTEQKQIEKLTAGLNIVSDEVELVKPVPKVVANN